MLYGLSTKKNNLANFGANATEENVYIFFLDCHFLLLLQYSGSVLHPNHYLLLGIKEVILQRLMLSINNKANYERLSAQEKVAALELRYLCRIAVVSH